MQQKYLITHEKNQFLLRDMRVIEKSDLKIHIDEQCKIYEIDVSKLKEIKIEMKIT